MIGILLQTYSISKCLHTEVSSQAWKILMAVMTLIVPLIRMKTPLAVRRIPAFVPIKREASNWKYTITFLTLFNYF